MDAADLLSQFESLGDNCEFGIVQRKAGLEPLGFFRLNFAPMPALIRGLDSDFAELSQLDRLEIFAAPNGELIARIRDYGFVYHTGRRVEDITPEALYGQQVKAIPFLIRKLLDDLRSAEKIFVRKGNDSARLDAIMPLLAALRRHGPATLLWVVPQDMAHSPGSVEVVQPGLLKGYIDRLADYHDAVRVSPVWVDICLGAHALWREGSPPGTIILRQAPAETNPISLLAKRAVISRRLSATKTDDGDLLLDNSTDGLPHEMQLTAITPCRNLADIRTIICGHSHGAAITSALVKPDDRGAPSPAWGTAEWLGIAGLRRAALGQSYWDLALRLVRTRDLVVIWQGNQYVPRLLLAPIPLLGAALCLLPDDPNTHGARLVAESALRQVLQPSLAGLEALLENAGHPPGCRRILLGTPPPLYDTELIRSRMHRESLFEAAAKERNLDLASAHITPGEIRREFWRVLQGLMAEVAARQGALFIPVPSGAFDAHGCLDPRYSAGDVMHCNVGYGILVLRELATHLL